MSDYISEDNLVQIFKWLPVKSLLRFRCVSSQWKGIIDSEFFMQEHLSVQKPGLIAHYDDPDEYLILDPQTFPLVETLSSPIEDDEAFPFRLVGTLHGVVCLYDNHNDFLIWNPCIHKLLIVPLPEVMEFGWDDEWEMAPYFGFWIDPSNKSFKILVFKLAFDKDDLVDGILYSSIEQEWINVPLDKFSDFRPLGDDPPVMIEGVAYWRANYEWEEEEYEVDILSFDFVKEIFNIIRLPQLDYSGWFRPIICNLQGSLSLVYWDAVHPYRCGICLWQEGIWVEMFSFNLLPHTLPVLGVLEGTEERCRTLTSVGGRLVMYDTKDGCIELQSGLRNSRSIYMAYDFVESLLFP